MKMIIYFTIMTTQLFEGRQQIDKDPEKQSVWDSSDQLFQFKAKNLLNSQKFSNFKTFFLKGQMDNKIIFIYQEEVLSFKINKNVYVHIFSHHNKNQIFVLPLSKNELNETFSLQNLSKAKNLIDQTLFILIRICQKLKLFIEDISSILIYLKILMQKLTFISNEVCPFAHRVWIALEEKQLPYEFRQVDLFQKEPYFTETYLKSVGHDPKSNGKVPIVVDGDTIVTESDLTTLYLLEKYEDLGNKQLIPKDPLERFKARQFYTRFEKLISNFNGYRGFLKKTPEEQEKYSKETDEILAELNDSIQLPYALGENFTVADIFIFPWFARWPALEAYLNQARSNKWTKIDEWIKNISSREAVKKTLMPDEYYVEQYKKYF